MIIMGLAIAGIFKQVTKNKSTIIFGSACKNILIAGMPSWIPALVTTIGAQIGTIVIFGTTGTSEAGTYYIAFSISQGIASISYSLLSTAFPVLSAMEDGRKRLTWRLIKISLIFSVPLSFVLIFYSEELLALLGQQYSKDALTLEILLFSTMPLGLMTGINILLYSYGNYRQVLYIGLASSVPRTVIYFILVPAFGGTGAAISFTIGSLIGFLVSILLAKRIGMLVFWKDLGLIAAAPSALSFAFSFLEVNYLVSIFVTIAGTFVLLLKINVLTKNDVEDSLKVLPNNISIPAIKILNLVGKKINRSY
jgi:O-antigen/teichoic acid export membrane protein